MKNVISYGVFLCCMLLLAGCSPSSPGKTLVKYSEYMQEGKYEQFVEGIAFDEKTPPEKVAEAKKEMAALLKEKAEKSIAKKGGFKEFEIISETVSEDGKTATVKMKTIYGDGETDESDTAMVLQDGVWKMKMGK